MRRMKKVAAATLTAIMVASIAMGTTESWARSSTRAAWNNAAAQSKDEEQIVNDACYAEDGSVTEERNVKSNVYANSEEWAAWKTKWESVRNNFCQIALTPGENATKLNAAWYSTTEGETPKIKLMDSTGREIKTYEGVQSVDTDVETVVDNGTTYTLYPCKVTVTDLTENTSYQYQYYVNGAWSDTYSYKTQSTESFSIMYVGDPQIGASTGQIKGENKEYFAMNDSYNWYHTLNNAVSKFPDLSFIMSAGDQINQSSVSKDADKLEQQIEYAGFLNPTVLRSLPVAVTIGNHDSKSVNYSNHFNYPNKQTSSDNTASKTAAGTDYYFTYGNTLFISIDTNNYNVTTHENVIKEATENNPDAKWRVLMFHQDIYGSGYDHSDSDGIVLRTQLTPVIDKYDIDAVLQGHDHTYSRTYQLTSDSKAHNSYTAAPSTSKTDEFNAYLTDNLCYQLSTGEKDGSKVVDPEGTVYFEANSATGSKYYQLIGTKQNYIAARCQSWRPTYSVIDITDTTLTVRTYDAATNEELVADGGVATAYTIVKQADKSALTSEVAKAEASLETAKAAGNFTEESVNALSDTIEAAKAILDNEESTTMDIASAVTSLQDAVKALKTADNSSDNVNNGTENGGNAADNNGNNSSDNNGNNTSDTTGSGNDNADNTADSSMDNEGTQTTDNSSDVTAVNESSDNSNTTVKTGDISRPAVYYTAAGISLIGIAGIVLADRKKKHIK